MAQTETSTKTTEIMVVNDLPGEECRVAILQENHLGRRRAVIADDLQKVLKTQYERTQLPIRDLAKHANFEGWPVCSITFRPEGFFFAETPGELETYARSLLHRSIKIAKRSSHLFDLRQTLWPFPGQDEV